MYVIFFVCLLDFERDILKKKRSFELLFLTKMCGLKKKNSKQHKFQVIFIKLCNSITSNSIKYYFFGENFSCMRK